jgi:hypothetical protein
VSTARRRVVALALAAATTAAGLAVHALLPGSPAADVAGDALYALLIVLGVIVLLPRVRSVAVGAVALGWCLAVELFQLTGLPSRWAEDLPVVALVLGSGFDPRDLIVYAIAVVVAVFADLRVRRRSAKR